MLRSAATITTLLGFACMAAGLGGCGEMKPRPAADVAVAPPPPPVPRATKDPNSPEIGHNSASTLGKARDAASRTVQRAEKHSEDVGKQADEIFKTK